jgi:putative ABC transport system ATP-binding protein
MALITLESVSKFFTMGNETLRALDGVTTTIDPGEFIAITGPSGCGKSTLMNLLGLLDQPTEGTLLLDGRNVSALSDDERAQLRNQKIGFVFQSFHLLPRASALRNVEMPLIYAASYASHLTPAERTRMATAALTRVGLADRLHHLPNELSGGQRQRVAIARALVNQPKILLGDEPTGNLDSRSGQEILKLFEELHEQGVTVILVTHDPKIAARCHRTLAMLDGKILEDRR